MSLPARGDASGRSALLQRRLGGTLALPSMPSILVRLREISGDPEAGVRDVAALIGQDPPLCARTLRIVNSAHVGLRTPVSSIEHAAAVLGMDALRNLLLQAQLSNLFEQLGEGIRKDVAALWKHSILVGRIAHQLSQRARGEMDANELELAGLLHDIGKFVLLELERETYLGLVRRAAAEQKSVLELERETFGFDHSDVGALLAARWNLPGTVERCIALHHSMDDLRGLRQPGVAALIFADRLARAVERRPSQPPRDLLAFLPARIAALLRFEPGEVPRMADYAVQTLGRIRL